MNKYNYFFGFLDQRIQAAILLYYMVRKNRTYYMPFSEGITQYEFFSERAFNSANCFSSAESIEEYILKSCDKSTSDKKYIAKLMQEVEELMEEYNLFVNLIIVKVHYPGFTGLCPYICDLSDVDLCAHSYIRDIAESVIDPSTAQMFITDRLAQYVLREDYDAIYKHNLALLPPGLIQNLYRWADIFYSTTLMG